MGVPAESEAPVARLSSIDEERFGIRVARAEPCTAETLPAVLAFSAENQVELIITRCPTTDLEGLHAMERRGFRLMDTLVYFERSLVHQLSDAPTGVQVRPIAPGEEQAVTAIASDAFKGYYGHYHADERLPNDLCDLAYIDWATKSCLSRDVADEVLVGEIDGELVGFATMKRRTSNRGEGVLFGVAPRAQGRGVYRGLMIGALQWCKSEGIKRMIVSTQITNLAVQKQWVRLGFEPSGAYYTLHCWPAEDSAAR